MPEAAGVVLAGGRSARMGTAKAALEWHGSTLLWRTVRVLQRATGGPVAVVRAAGQDLPPLPPEVLVVADPRDGLGPVQGIAAGLAALCGLAEVAFVGSTDLPFLHPAFVRRVLQAALAGADVALPVARGYRQPLAASYRISLAPAADRLAASGLLKPAFLLEQCNVAVLDEAELLTDHELAAGDPDLESVVNVNSPADYRAARNRPAPLVTVRWAVTSGLADGGPQRREQVVRAATVAEAAAACGPPGAGVTGAGVTAVLNDGLVTADGQMPLVARDAVELRVS